MPAQPLRDRLNRALDTAIDASRDRGEVVRSAAQAGGWYPVIAAAVTDVADRRPDVAIDALVRAADVAHQRCVEDPSGIQPSRETLRELETVLYGDLGPAVGADLHQAIMTGFLRLRGGSAVVAPPATPSRS